MRSSDLIFRMWMQQSLKGIKIEMTRLAVATITLFAVSASLAFAQDSTPKVQVFGGYSFVQAGNGKLSPQTLYNALHEPNNPFGVSSTFMGWSAEGQYNFNRWIGVAVYFGGRSGTPITQSEFIKLSGLPSATGYTLMVGPVLSYRTKSKFTPYVHALFGYDRLHLNASTIGGLVYPLSSTATTFNDVAIALGGGVDYRILRGFSLRLVQLDDLETTHNFNNFYGTAFSTGLFNTLATHERNLRISTGIVVRF